jgi:hypothetical protein
MPMATSIAIAAISSRNCEYRKEIELQHWIIENRDHSWENARQPKWGCRLG